MINDTKIFFSTELVWKYFFTTQCWYLLDKTFPTPPSCRVIWADRCEFFFIICWYVYLSWHDNIHHLHKPHLQDTSQGAQICPKKYFFLFILCKYASLCHEMKTKTSMTVAGNFLHKLLSWKKWHILTDVDQFETVTRRHCKLSFLIF